MAESKNGRIYLQHKPRFDRANHISLVDRREHAMQTSAVILDVVEAVRTGQPLE
jgi:hypothetical protein